MGMYGPITTPAAVGADGAAAATGYSNEPVNGVLVGITVQYNDAPPAGTTDIGVKTKGLSGTLPSINLLTITNAATNGYFPTRAPTYTAAGVLDNGTAPFPVHDTIQVDIAGANAGDSVTIWLELV